MGGIPCKVICTPQGVRGTIVSATGSGKTITAAACALESFADGRILVTVPTLDLLAQTAQAWRLVGHRAPMVAVCSLENDAVLGSLGVRSTTNPIQLALWGRRPQPHLPAQAPPNAPDQARQPQGRTARPPGPADRCLPPRGPTWPPPSGLSLRS